MTNMLPIPQYPWTEGDHLFASALNAAFANSVKIYGSITVKDYGAKGDAVTDDTAAIQAAANAVPVSGGGLIFPPGNYVISAPINLLSSTVVQATGATITAAPAAAWGSSGVSHGFHSTGVNDITVNGLNFSWPVGWSNVGPGGSHLLAFISCNHIKIFNCTSNGGSDLTAMIGCTDTLVQGCTALNVSNVAYDHWQGTTDARVIGCYASCDTTEPHGGMGCISFTGMATGNGPANTAGFICIGNVCYCGVANSQVISINGHPSAGYDNKVIVANNMIYAGAGTTIWGILMTGMVNNAWIHHNYLEGNSFTYAAIAAYAPATNVRIEHNIAVNWTADSGHGIFQNQCVGGSLVGNVAYACSSPTVGPGADATALVYGNDSGTGTNTFGSPVVFQGAFTVNGAAAFHGALSVAGLVDTSGITVANAQYLGLTDASGSQVYFGVDSGNTLALFGTDGAGATRTVFTMPQRSSTSGAQWNVPMGFNTVGFNNNAPMSKPTVTGSKAGNAALASLLSALQAYGLVTDGSS